MVIIIAKVARQIFVIFFYRGRYIISFRLLPNKYSNTYVYQLYVLCMNYDCKIKKFTKMNSGCILL